MCSLFYFNFLLLFARTTQSSLTISNCVYILENLLIYLLQTFLFQRTFNLFLGDDAVVFIG